MKANPTISSAVTKLQAIGLMVTTLVWAYPTDALASSLQQEMLTKALVFDVKQKEELTSLYGYTVGTSPKEKLAQSVKEYLAKRNSPLADCDNIIEQNNWKKILSLANAESGLGKRTIPGTHNYWGVMAGSTLKVMADNKCDAIANMNEFLANFPRRSEIKYQDMPIERMNGLYKQPYALHWTINNKVIINDLTKLEKDAYGPLLTDIEPEVILARK